MHLAEVNIRLLDRTLRFVPTRKFWPGPRGRRFVLRRILGKLPRTASASAASTDTQHKELVAVELRVGMPDVNFVLALFRQFLCIRLIAMTLAECGHVVLQRPIVVVPPSRRGEWKVPHDLVAARFDGS